MGRSSCSCIAVLRATMLQNALATRKMAGQTSDMLSRADLMGFSNLVQRQAVKIVQMPYDMAAGAVLSMTLLTGLFPACVHGGMLSGLPDAEIQSSALGHPCFISASVWPRLCSVLLACGRKQRFADSPSRHRLRTCTRH